MFNKNQILSTEVSHGKFADFMSAILHYADSRLSAYACLANVHMLVEASNDAAFATIVNNADIVTPDGVPLTWALRLLYGIKQERVAGMDLLPALLAEAQVREISVFFYGGTNEMLQTTSQYINDKFPDLKIAGIYSPPFRSLNAEEEKNIVTQINSSGAQLVFVVLGCPKQERWMAAMKGRVNAMMVGIGGALPVLVCMQKRAPQWMQQTGLEWLFRLCQEPGRLFKRYAITNTFFLYLLVKEIIKIHLLKRKLSPA